MNRTPLPNPADPWEPLIERIANRVVEKLKAGDGPRLLTPAEAGRYIGRSARWVRLEVLKGNLKAVNPDHARPRFDKAELDRWIEEH